MPAGQKLEDGVLGERGGSFGGEGGRGEGGEFGVDVELDGAVAGEGELERSR
jgi:hypothetical protein